MSVAREAVSGGMAPQEPGAGAVFRSDRPLSAAADDLLSLGMRADRLRRQLHPEGVVSYTNTARIEVEADAAVASVLARAEAACGIGARGIVLGFSAEPPALDTLSTLIRGLREGFPLLTIAGCSAGVVAGMAAREGLPVAGVLRQLQAAGLESLAPEEAIASQKDWIELHRAAHLLGIRTTAVLPVLPAEAADERLRRLEAIDSLQQETAGFVSLALTAPPSASLYLSDELTAVEFLTALAMARLALPNILNIESSWPAQGLKLLQMTLRFGANDAGSTLLERTLRQPGPDTPTEEDLRRVIRDAGFQPVERSPDYTTCYLP